MSTSDDLKKEISEIVELINEVTSDSKLFFAEQAFEEFVKKILDPLSWKFNSNKEAFYYLLGGGVKSDCPGEIQITCIDQMLRNINYNDYRDRLKKKQELSSKLSKILREFS